MHVDLGGKGDGLAEEVDIKKDHTIVIRGKRYAASDAMCCPSLPYESIFVVKDGRITQK
jgi:hypothetical protein